jgi:hypothetical protein
VKLYGKEKEEVVKKILKRKDEDVYCTGALGRLVDCWHIDDIHVYVLEANEFSKEMGIDYAYLVYTDGKWKVAELFKYEKWYRGGYGERCSSGTYDIKVLLDNEAVAEGVWSYYSCVPPLSARWAHLSLRLLKPVVLAIADPFVIHILVPPSVSIQ